MNGQNLTPLNEHDDEIRRLILKRRTKASIKQSLASLCCLLAGTYIAAYAASVAVVKLLLYLPVPEKLRDIAAYASTIPVFVCQLLIPAAIFLILKRRSPADCLAFEDCAECEKVTVASVAMYSLIAFALSNIMAVISSFFTVRLGLDEAAFEIRTANNPWEFIIDIIGIALIPALLEEFFFRGLILGELLPHGKSFALVTSALLFASAHGSAEQMIYSFVYGLIFAFVTVKTGSLKTGIIMHFLNNAYSCSAEYLGRVIGSGIGVLIMNLVHIGLITAGLWCLVYAVAKDKFKFSEREIDCTEPGALTPGETFPLLLCPVMLVYYGLVLAETLIVYFGY